MMEAFELFTEDLNVWLNHTLIGNAICVVMLLVIAARFLLDDTDVHSVDDVDQEEIDWSFLEDFKAVPEKEDD